MPYDVGGVEYGGELILTYADEVEHRSAPTAVFDVEIEGAAVVRDIAPEDAAHLVGDEIFGKHDLGDAGEVVGFMTLQPHEFGRGEAGERDIARPFEELIFADDIVEIGAFLDGTVVVPKYGGTDDVVVAIEDDEPVHLSGEGHTPDLIERVTAAELADAGHHPAIPICGILFRPPVRGERQRVFCGRAVRDTPVVVGEDEFDG